MDLGKTPIDNDLLTIFVIGFIRTSRQSFTSHVGIESTAQKALDYLFSKCIYNGYAGISYTNGVPSAKVLEGKPPCIFNIC